MLQDVLRKLSLSQLEYDRYNQVASQMQWIWGKLCEEFELNLEDHPLTILNTNQYPTSAARRLAALGYNVDPSTFECSIQDGNQPIFITSSHLLTNNVTKTTHYLCNGVYGMADFIMRCVENDGEAELPIKYQCLEILMRHEIGHILSMRKLFDNKTEEMSNALNREIEALNFREQSRWNTGDSRVQRMLNHYNLPLEALANTAVRITPQMCVDAACILVEVL